MRKFKGLPLLIMFLICCQVALAQSRVVSGRVVDDATNTPLAGVSVQAGTAATITDSTGFFSLNVPAGVSRITFSYVGYEQQEAPANAATFNIRMVSGTRTIEEVVVTGYTTIQRKKFSGASVAAPIREIRSQPLASFDQALQGNAAGVSVIGASGQPGANAIVRIRGNGSISGGNVPLYILDGIQISAADFQSLNQGDFESVEILKDAVATAQYGSRGANGVIVITTRKGRAGTMQLNYDAQVGFSRLPKDRMELLTSRQKIDLELANGNPNGWSAAEADSLRNVFVDWRDVLFQTGITQTHQISASGGTANNRFYASLAYMHQDGIVKTTGLERYTARVNVDNVIKNWRFGMNFTGGYSVRNGTEEGETFTNQPLNALRWTNPYDAPYLANGEYNQFISGGVPTGQFRSGQPNGALELFENRRRSIQLKAVASTYLEYHFPFLKGLYARTNWGMDYTQVESDNFYSPLTSAYRAVQGSLVRGMGRNYRYTGTSSVNYRKTTGKHEFDGGLFFEVVKNTSRSFSFVGRGFSSDFRNEAGITPGSTTNPQFIPQVTGSGTENGILSYFGIFNYGYDGKYYVSLVGRRDGSSRFGINNRFANFGSIGLTWVASEEQFLQNVRWLSDLRVRASYGTTGSNNSPLGDFPIPLLGNASYNGVVGFVPSSPGNLNYGWETNRTINLGIEYALFRNRVSGTIDIYDRLTKDLFYSVPVDPAGGGFASIPGNFGKLRNRGIELMLRGDVVRTRDFRFTLQGNLSYNANRIVQLPQDSVVSGGFILAQGFPINSYFMVPFAGVNSANGNALYRTLDKGLTEVYNVADRVILGTTDAPWYGGLTTTIAFKGFDLSAQLNFFMGRVIFNNERNNLINPAYVTDNMSSEVLRAWKQPGDVTDVPRFTQSGGNAYQANTSRLVEDGDFARLRNVTLGYTFSSSLLSRARIRSARVFVQGQNLATWTRFQNFDPEVGQLSGSQYPNLVQMTAGLSVGF